MGGFFATNLVMGSCHASCDGDAIAERNVPLNHLLDILALSRGYAAMLAAPCYAVDDSSADDLL
ncbi:MAG TPA: hypothetical protein VF920_04565, partial [Dongiaceae bacterium]